MVRWSLPASKTDVEARGSARSHGCNCAGDPSASCPFHAMERQLARLRRLFPGRWSAEGPDPDLPLFPTAEGEVVTKERMTATIVDAARRLQVPLEAADRSARVSGHSLRVTGAQGLARAGVDTWAIQLMGRWGSSAVLGYVRDAPLELSTTWAARAAAGISLEQLLASRRGLSSPSPPSTSTLPFRALPAPVTEPSVLPPDDIQLALEDAERAECVEVAAPSLCRFVASTSGKWHRLSNPSLTSLGACWTSVCGWRFVGSSVSLQQELPAGLCHKWLCARCFPELRQSIKDGS